MISVTAKLGNVLQCINGNGQNIKGTISQEAGAISSFPFDIYEENKGFDLIRNRKTIIRAVNTITGREEFAGRVLLAQQIMDAKGVTRKVVTCESFLGYLHDSFQPYAEEDLYTLEGFIDMVLANHNAVVEEEKHIFRGRVDVPVADTGYVYKGLQYQSTYTTLKTKLVDVYGGELEIEEINGVLYLNYLQQTGVTRSTQIKYGHNMQQASREISPLNIITRIRPLGAKITGKVTQTDGSIAEQETNQRLTLQGYVAPDGTEFLTPWVDDLEKQKDLGIVCGDLDFSDVTEQSNLYRKTMEYMAKDNLVDLSHTLTAYDLKEVGIDIDSLNCCDSYPVINERIGLNEVLRITKKTIDISSPYKGTITIGEKKTSLSNIQASEKDKLGLQVQQIADKMQAVNNSVNSAVSTFSSFMTSLEQTVQGIVSKAVANYVTESDLERISQELSTTISQTAQGVKTEFTKTITTVEHDLNNHISSIQAELKGYINYYMDDAGRPVVELGSSSSGVYSQQTSEKYAILENGVELFSAHKNKLQATDMTILRRLMLAGYAIDPSTSGSNAGAVSIFKVGGGQDGELQRTLLYKR